VSQRLSKTITTAQQHHIVQESKTHLSNLVNRAPLFYLLSYSNAKSLLMILTFLNAFDLAFFDFGFLNSQLQAFQSIRFLFAWFITLTCFGRDHKEDLTHGQVCVESKVKERIG
jgi:hypothetical protein